MNRHELKEQVRNDQFTTAVSGVVNYTVSHRRQVITWAIALALVLVAAGVGLWYWSSQRAAREADLQAALAVLEAPVAAQGVSGQNFPTQDAKNIAARKALQSVISKDSGTREGLVAQYYLGTLKAQTGDPKGAEADLRTVAGSSSETASLAKVALAQLYAGQNKLAEAQGYLRELVNKPTDLVSKSQAQLLLAQLLQPGNPAEAKKIIQSVRKNDQSPAVTRAADQIVPSTQK